MNRDFRNPDERLACLSHEEKAMFAARSAKELVDHCDSLLVQEERIEAELERIRERRTAIELMAQWAMKRDRRDSMTTRRHDGVRIVWRPHRDGSGFERTRLDGHIKPDAGAG